MLHRKFYTKKPAKTDRQKLINKLDESFSLWIRLRDSDDNGMVKCITCGTIAHFTEMDAGHFVTRDNMGTRWEEENVSGQCRHCNRFRSGEQYEHGLAIDKKFKKPGTAAMLVIKGKSVCNWTDKELETMHQYYKAGAKEFKQAKGMV
jgi:5-methylcytosine-specific restriction endonuclease McrA